MDDNGDPLDHGLQRLETLLERLPRVTNVAQNNNRGSFAAAVAAAVCVLCLVVLVIACIFINGMLRDLWAWKDVYGQRLQNVESQVSHLEKKS